MKMNAQKNKKSTTVLWMILTAAMAGFACSSCNTTEGLGQDLQRLGEKIEDKSQDVQTGDNYEY